MQLFAWRWAQHVGIASGTWNIMDYPFSFKLRLSTGRHRPFGWSQLIPLCKWRQCQWQKPENFKNVAFALLCFDFTCEWWFFALWIIPAPRVGAEWLGICTTWMALNLNHITIPVNKSALALASLPVNASAGQIQWLPQERTGHVSRLDVLTEVRQPGWPV